MNDANETINILLGLVGFEKRISELPESQKNIMYVLFKELKPATLFQIWVKVCGATLEKYYGEKINEIVGFTSARKVMGVLCKLKNKQKKKHDVAFPARPHLIKELNKLIEKKFVKKITKPAKYKTYAITPELYEHWNYKRTLLISLNLTKKDMAVFNNNLWGLTKYE